MVAKHHRRHLWPVGIAAAVTLPGIFLFVTGSQHALLGSHAHPAPTAYIVAILAGLAVLGASFLLLWACDAVQEDISQTLALAIVALIAVLPEYAVDMYITWQAGVNPDKYAHLAIANMTGANRLIIGVAWLAIAVVYWAKTRKAVRLGNERKMELFFLGLATLYAFIIPIKGTLEWYDGLVFIGIYAWYIRLAGKRPCEECEVEGPAEMLLSLPKLQRRLGTIGMFLFAALAIGLNAEQFSEGLINTGHNLQVPEELLIQWLAPIASEAPEFIVAIMFALRLRAGMALGSLLSAKLNQWTLLVGMIPFVYLMSALYHKAPTLVMPMNGMQMHEIMLTAAQSLLGLIILASMRLSIGQALLIFGLFAGQLVLPPIIDHFPHLAPFGLKADQIHPLFSLLYFVAAIAIFLEKPARLLSLYKGIRVEIPAVKQTCPLEDHCAEHEQAPTKEKAEV